MHASNRASEKAQARCEHCQSENIVKNGQLKRLIRDVPRAGRPTYIEFVGQKWMCKACGKTWIEYPPGIRQAQATEALVGYVVASKGKKTQEKTMRECGLALRTVKAIQKQALGARKYQRASQKK